MSSYFVLCVLAPSFADAPPYSISNDQRQTTRVFISDGRVPLPPRDGSSCGKAQLDVFLVFSLSLSFFNREIFINEDEHGYIYICVY